MRRQHPPRMIVLVPGLAVPKYMDFLLHHCRPVRQTRKAVEAGHLLLIDHHPPYLQLECEDPEKIIEEARRRGLRVYRGKKHITITDGIYQARIYTRRDPDKT
jgi:hypothetical protein